jgi:chemotaxis protein histidine kinase CheA
VRNAVDHGIEDEATRRAAGKDPCGTVTISARTEGPHALLEVSDDGGGLDFDRIRELAIERGLMDEDSEPTRAELRELLFHPGFTVKTEATEISGRGVGLDAVREGVIRIGGVVEIDDTGVGSRFRLRVPITLSILPALEVEAAGQVAFLPLAHVRRVLRVDASRLERGPERTLFVEGDHAVTVARLDEVLTGASGSTEPGFGVILGLADRRRLLRVDRIGRRREVVVRSLGELLSNVPGVSGCTELGDGRTILILDVLALFETGTTPAGTWPAPVLP